MIDTMYYVLDNSVRLRKWKGSDGCIQYADCDVRYVVSEQGYRILRSCNAETDLEPDDFLSVFEKRGVIKCCKKGEYSLQNGQMREFPNYYFRDIDWTITDRCNYNCLHCFHAADNERRRDEFSREEASTLIEEAAACGIRGIRITGGEPTLYPYFREVIKEIRDKGLKLVDLITNGSFLDEELLDYIRELHPKVPIMLSYDGIGTHEWLRQHAGSEEQVKKAIRLCKSAGMHVKINMNVNRRNRDVIPESVKMLADMGVDSIRIIRTTEAPRWQLNAGGDSLTVEEYYDFSLDFAEQYRKSNLLLPVVIWQSLALYGGKRKFYILPEKSCTGEYCGDDLLCNAWINKVSIQANGEIMPCAPMGGYNELMGISMGNVKREGLQKLLTEGPFIDFIRHMVKDKKKSNPKCGGCKYFGHCQGGCPSLSILTGGNLLASDQFKCIFYEKGYYDRYCEAKQKMEADYT